MAIFSHKRHLLLSLHRNLHSSFKFDSTRFRSYSTSIFHPLKPNLQSSPISSSSKSIKILSPFNLPPLMQKSIFKTVLYGGRTFATQLLESSSGSEEKEKETMVLEGCDFEHWLVVVEPPDRRLTRDEIIDGYIKTLAQVIGSEQEARMKIYSVSTRHYFAFGALISEELGDELKKVPNVRWVLPDSYMDFKNKTYSGEPFINGQAVPYDPKYHAVWVRNHVETSKKAKDKEGKQQDANSQSRSLAPGSTRGIPSEDRLSSLVPEIPFKETSNTQSHTFLPSSVSHMQNHAPKTAPPLYTPSQAPPTYSPNQAFQPSGMQDSTKLWTPPQPIPGWASQSHIEAPSVGFENQPRQSSYVQNQTPPPAAAPTRGSSVGNWIPSPSPQYSFVDTSKTQNHTSQSSPVSYPVTHRQNWMPHASPNVAPQTAVSAQMQTPFHMQNHARNQAPPPYSPNQAPPPYSPSQGSPPYSPNQAPPPYSPNQALPPFSLNQAPSTYSPNQGPPYSLNQAPSTYSPNQAPPPYSPNQAPPPYSLNQAPSTYSPNQAPPPYFPNQAPPPYSLHQGAPPYSQNRVPPTYSPNQAAPMYSQKQAPPTYSPNQMPWTPPPPPPAQGWAHKSQIGAPLVGFGNQAQQPSPSSTSGSYNNPPPSVFSSPYHQQTRGPTSDYQIWSPPPPTVKSFSYDNVPPSAHAGETVPAQVPRNGPHQAQNDGFSNGYSPQSFQQQQHQNNYHPNNAMLSSTSVVTPSAQNHPYNRQTWGPASGYQNQSPPVPPSPLAGGSMPSQVHQNGYPRREIPHQAQNSGSSNGYSSQQTWGTSSGYQIQSPPSVHPRGSVPSQVQPSGYSYTDIRHQAQNDGSPNCYSSQSVVPSSAQNYQNPNVPLSTLVQSEVKQNGYYVNNPPPLQHNGAHISQYQQYQQDPRGVQSSNATIQNTGYNGGRMLNDPTMEIRQTRDYQGQDIPMYASR